MIETDCYGLEEALANIFGLSLVSKYKYVVYFCIGVGKLHLCSCYIVYAYRLLQFYLIMHDMYENFVLYYKINSRSV